jgi:hypothetical protein
MRGGGAGGVGGLDRVARVERWAPKMVASVSSVVA